MLEQNIDSYDEKLEDFTSEYIILLNNVEIHNKQKYLLIVGQDLKTKSIFKLIDTHGMNFELYKYCDNWAQIQKGDVIRLKCVHYDSNICNNVLRVRSNYELVKSVNYYEEIIKTDSIEYVFSEQEEHILEIYDFKYMKFDKKSYSKYSFELLRLENIELIKYLNNENKIKYQLDIPMDFSNFYADIILTDSSVENRVGHYYSGFVLMQFAVKNNRIRAKIYDFLNEDNSFKKIYNPFDDKLPF